ncbi:MAG: tetratricopeptide repeat protein [Acidobacteria bacterium]|nr:tetratricopeptide repeat protein [Acidobacteriota bacterium]
MAVAFLFTFALPAILFSQQLSVPAVRSASAKAAAEFRKSQEALNYNRIDKAIDHLQKGIALDPANLSAYNDLGTIYFNTNQFERAVEAFRRMVQINPDSFRGHLNLAFALFSQQRYAEAEPVARRAFDLNPTDTRGRYLLGASLSLQQKNLGEARTHLSAAAPEMVEARYQLAHLLIDSGELEAGMRQLQIYQTERIRAKR